jgi:hypothetical protein
MANGRWLAGPLAAALGRPYVHILFGARQTGKSTLLRTGRDVRSEVIAPPASATAMRRPGELQCSR